MLGGAKERHRERLLAFAGRFARPGEYPVASLPMMQRGAHPQLGMVAVLPWIGSISAPTSGVFKAGAFVVFVASSAIMQILRRVNGVVVTNQRWILVETSRWNAKPQRIEEDGAAGPIAGTFKRGLTADKVIFVVNGESRRWWVALAWRSEAQSLVAALPYPAMVQSPGPTEWAGTGTAHPDALPPPPSDF
ncbi:MAG: hypothetical protein WBD02_08730 [Acidimicrobiia bacterium]